ncbi:MAG: beta-propeller domain-containing protein [Methanospirillum sp.]|uniref:beta-propeller domain-containing protein n=1 Tax=Methanospirillum sp. TaxID=45200 RepID=UPI00236FFD89|nr:beta-propeller domain-containing protein [Methanospirillum sp.]MDD1728282.1 beta-propeller domain-containing protein [Methanospirillum sp.]
MLLVMICSVSADRLPNLQPEGQHISPEVITGVSKTPGSNGTGNVAIAPQVTVKEDTSVISLILGIMPVFGDNEENPLALKKISSAEGLELYFINQTRANEEKLAKEKAINSQKKDYTFGITDPGKVNYNFESQAVAGSLQNGGSRHPVMEPENQVFSLDSATGNSQSRSGTDVASTYSTTNIQVTGVDEPDFIKNDGKYIYLISKNTLTIVDAYPAQNAKIVSQIPVEGDVSDIFLNGDRLVIFTGKNGQNLIKLAGSVAPVPSSEYQTHALVYSIIDRAHPELLRDISIPGKYQNARMIDGDIYVLNQESRTAGDYHMPVLFDGKKEIAIRNVRAPQVPPENYVFYSLSSFNIHNDAQPTAESFLLGRDSTLYVSPGNVYIAYKNQGTNPGSMPAQQKSIVHRFSIKDGKISYKSTGIFPGYLLNQFSLDEFEGNLRVATTIDVTGNNGGRSNGVYVLDPDMIVIGSLDHLASGEKIYSARFMGDLLYLVTFKTMDPLFVIDLSNPKNPGILGELKIPGYSDYLHPYDETHLIGIGKDTTPNQWGVSATGIKIALFDVSNLTNPLEVGHVIIGEKGSDSEVLHDHRAFLLDQRNNVMAIPIKEITNTPTPGSQYNGSYIPSIWQGTYVYGIDPKNGFTEKGKITKETITMNNYYEQGSAVKRSLLMDSILYTISPQNIMATDINDISRPLANITW